MAPFCDCDLFVNTVATPEQKGVLCLVTSLKLWPLIVGYRTVTQRCCRLLVSKNAITRGFVISILFHVNIVFAMLLIWSLRLDEPH